jgi:hypothetical protein
MHNCERTFLPSLFPFPFNKATLKYKSTFNYDSHNYPSTIIPAKMILTSISRKKRSSSMDHTCIASHSKTSPTNESESNISKSEQGTVTFAPKVKVKHTISRKDMTTKEKENTWIQDDEARSIKQRCQQIVKKVDEQGFIDEATSDIRGLESNLNLNNARQQTQENRFIAVEEILYEQDSQREFGYNDVALIALQYKTVSRKCQVQAELIANKDRAAILDYIYITYKYA